MSTEQKLDKIIEIMSTKFDQIDNRFEQIDNRFDQIDNRFDQVDKRFDELENEVKETKADIAEINLRLENEISRNIQIIAEGHLDLSRNLHDAMTPSNEVEMLRIKVSLLESKINNLEKRMEMQNNKKAM